ncbi:MAG: hypothetical protein WAK19_16915, partial [Candidatus Cybelea sp.]
SSPEPLQSSHPHSYKLCQKPPHVSAGCAYSSPTCYCGYADGCPGAGGGGGYYGGGGGGGGAGEYASVYGGAGGAGGGGSSWAKSSVADFRTWGGWKDATGDGLVVFSW